MRSSGVYFSNLKFRFRSLLEARGAWQFVLLIVAIQGVVTLVGGHDSVPWVYENFGLNREGVFSGKLWQLLTYGLFHGGFFHVVINAFCVVMIGSRIEHVLGSRAVWKTLVAGIFGGAIGHLLAAPRGETEPLLVGASGGCMGLLILLTTLSPESRMWPLPVSAKNLGLGVMVTALLFAVMDPRLKLPGFSEAGEWLSARGLAGWFVVGHACHLGGGVAGFLLGRWLLRPRVTADRLRRERERREARQVR